MHDAIEKLLREQNIHAHQNQGMLIASMQSQEAGLTLVSDILTAIVDSKTMLLLSGGRTPKDLYTKIAADERIIPGMVGLIDERYGEKWHKSSNETMIRETGLLRYLQMRDVPFYPILQQELSRVEAAEEYDEKVRSLFAVYQKTIATLGIGLDGHTAGIAGNRKDFVNPMFDGTESSFLVSEFDDPKGMFKERITMTFTGLSMIDLIIVLVFGDDKKKALELLFTDGPEEEVPSRLLKRPEIAAKTIIITDQGI